MKLIPNEKDFLLTKSENTSSASYIYIYICIHILVGHLLSLGEIACHAVDNLHVTVTSLPEKEFSTRN